VCVCCMLKVCALHFSIKPAFNRVVMIYFIAISVTEVMKPNLFGGFRIAPNGTIFIERSSLTPSSSLPVSNRAPGKNGRGWTPGRGRTVAPREGEFKTCRQPSADLETEKCLSEFTIPDDNELFERGEVCQGKLMNLSRWV